MVRVTNVIATADLGCTIQLGELERKNGMAFYDPKRFSGLIIRRLAPVKAHCQVYSNGKVTVNGGTSVAQSLALTKLFALDIQVCGFPVSLSKFTVANVIGSLDMGHGLKIEKISSALRAEYTPEIFPGLAIHLETCTAVLFHSGKVNFVGAKSEEDLQEAEFELKVLIN